MGAAMRFMTSAPAPTDHMIGRSPMNAAATVIIFWRCARRGWALAVVPVAGGEQWRR